MISLLFEHYFLIGILVYLIFGIWMNLSPLYGFPKLTVNWTYLCSLLIVNSIILLLVNYNEGSIFYNELFYKTHIEFLLNLFTLVMALFIVLGTAKYLELNKVNVFEYYIFFLLVVYSLLLIVGSTEFFSFYFALELLSMSLYLLASYRKNYKSGIEAGIKYFIISSISSVLILFGFSIIYLYTGLTNFSDIYLFNLNTPVNSYMYLSFMLMLSGFLIKLYSAPFHLWVADIYEGAYTSVVLIFASLPLLNVYYIFYKLYNFLYIQLDLSTFFYVLIPLTLVVGTLGAFYQVKLKRLLAYSSIANIGYFLIYFLYPSTSMSYIVFAYMLFYCLSILSFLLVVCNLYDVSKKKSIENWNELVGLYYSNKWLFVILILIIFSMGGLPPFPVFVAKWLLLSKLLSLKAYSLVALIILITFATFYYYIRIIKQMTYYTDNGIILKPVSYFSSFLIFFVFFFNIVIGFYFYFIYSDSSLLLGNFNDVAINIGNGPFKEAVSAKVECLTCNRQLVEVVNSALASSNDVAMSCKRIVAASVSDDVEEIRTRAFSLYMKAAQLVWQNDIEGAREALYECLEFIRSTSDLKKVFQTQQDLYINSGLDHEYIMHFFKGLLANSSTLTNVEINYYLFNMTEICKNANMSEEFRLVKLTYFYYTEIYATYYLA